ncbi:hypothetical protein J0910_24100 [Nocardiopsis sp. CNT-189]|uniref:hypothetical protein n=1 Tax=Nocardiopsis oceanisediminis TaxID=2816862 RepID=UPI003B299BAB
MDNVARIEAAPTARRRAAKEAFDADQADRAQHAQAQRIAEFLHRDGAVVITCADDDQREASRRAGRRAGRIRGHRIRTMVLETGDVAVWEPDRHTNPLQVRLDARRADRRLDEALRAMGPLTGPQPPD